MEVKSHRSCGRPGLASEVGGTLMERSPSPVGSALPSVSVRMEGSCRHAAGVSEDCLVWEEKPTPGGVRVEIGGERGEPLGRSEFFLPAQ